jgi:hypothetical protein
LIGYGGWSKDTRWQLPSLSESSITRRDAFEKFAALAVK